MNRSPYPFSALTVALVVAVAVAGAVSAAPASAAASKLVSATQEVARLDHDTQAFSRPSRDSRAVTELSDVRPITHERTVLPVIARRTTDGATWLEVLLPGRPNGHSGWIAKRAATLAATRWQIIVTLSTRQVSVFWDGHLSAKFEAVVGKPSTPTPTGRFFVEETVTMSPGAAGAPYALALSARSTVLATYDGGPGQTALHGTDNIGGVLGTAESHGCIRLSTPAITWLATRIAPGTPVTIVP
jgi:lipoprotein-anchoring transpeptidase ErfK/SrfK